MNTPKYKRVIAAVRTAEEAVRPVATQLTEALRQLEFSLSPFLGRLKEWSDALAPHLQAFAEWNRAVDALNEVGWLAYRSVPFRYVEECGNDLPLLDRSLANYYRTRWSEIREDLESRLEDYHIDDEAKETFREALSAHEAGLYRCVCRVLFPEIERVIGTGEIFYSLAEAAVLVEQWRREYNTIRPHSACGGFPPAPEAIKPSPWFLRMPVLHGPPQVLGLT